MYNKAAITLCLASVVFFATAQTASADDYDLSWWTLDGGGVMLASGGDYELSGTIGQADTGTMSGGDFTLTGGFWFEQPPGDCNADGIVDLLDYSDLVPCLDGPDVSLSDSFCRCFDFDVDDDIDLMDFAEFQKRFDI